MCALKHGNAAGAEEGAVNGSSGIQRNLFSIRGSLPGKRGSAKVRHEKRRCGRGDGVRPPTAFTRFLISSPNPQLPVGWHTETHSPCPFHFSPHWTSPSSVTCHKRR